jgi:hypothetical protein
VFFHRRHSWGERGRTAGVRRRAGLPDQVALALEQGGRVMGLQRRTIQKLLREDFPGTRPLVVDLAAREKLAADLAARLKHFDNVDTKDHGYLREEEKTRFVCSFTITDPNAYYYYAYHTSFRLLLDDAHRLTLEATTYSRDSALVSDLEEVVRFVRDCKQRLERHKALRAKRGKVRDLLAQAILAHVRKLAREERFDFMSDLDEQKFKLFVKLTDDHALLLHIPFKDYQKFLPQLGPAIVALRQLYLSGIRFEVVGRRKLPWRKSWVTHESL